MLVGWSARCALTLLLVGALSGCGPLLLGTIAGGGVVYLMQERSAGSAVDDFTMWASVRNRLLQYGGSDFVDVRVDVVEGRIMLTGKVKSTNLRLQAARAAWEQDGVREVINEIQLYGDGNYAAVYARDLSLTSQAKARLLMTKSVRSVNYSIETVDGIVYIFGTAYDKDELETVTSVISRLKGVQKVVAHVRLRKDLKRKIVSESVGTDGDLWDW
jgi:osmotically-inducible protein OsmY